MPTKKKTEIELPEIDDKEQLVTIKNAENANQLVYGDSYTKFLKIAPEINAEAQGALKAIEDAKSEKEIKNARALSKQAKDYKRTIDKARKFIKDQMDEQKEAALAQFDKDLEEAGVNDLLDTLEKIGKCEKDLINQRKISRWKELEDVFNKTLPNYPDLSELTFDWFKSRHEKLISGAVTRKVTDDNKALVTNELYKLDTNIQSVKMMEQQNLFDDEALESLKKIITDKINGEDGGISGFQADIANAIAETNERKTETQHEALIAEAKKIKEEKAAKEAEETSNESIEEPTTIDKQSAPTETNEVPAEENVPAPDDSDMPPVDDEDSTIPPEEELAAIEANNEAPMNDDTKIISPAIPQMILEANNALFNGDLTNEDQTIRADAKMKFIQLIIDAELHYDSRNGNHIYIHQLLNVNNDLHETYKNIFDAIEEISKL